MLSLILTAFLALILATCGQVLGRRLNISTSLGILTAIAAPSIVLTGWFYIANIPTWAYLAVPTITLSAIIVINWRYLNLPKLNFNFPKYPLGDLSLNTLFYICIFTTLFQVIYYQTTDYLPTIFAVLDYKFFIILSAGLVALFYTQLNKQKLFLLFFTLFNLANIIYTLGYGYDTFIHQATENLLLETGTISPKPPLYIGYYTLTLWLASITQIDLSLIDKFLPSVLTSFALAIAVQDKKSLALFLIIPFSLLTTPTPQALALGLMIMQIFLLTKSDLNFKVVWPHLPVFIWIFAIHPLAAIPVFIYTGLALIRHRALQFGFVIISLLLYPLAFVVASGISANSVSFKFLGLDFLNLFKKFQPLQFDFIKDFTYLLTALVPIIFVILIALGHRHIKSEYNKFILIIILLLNAIILSSFFQFDSLHQNEKTFFVERIFTITFYCAIPFIIYYLKGIRLSAFQNILVLGLILSNIYISYPRYDRYQPTKLYNVTDGTFQAVSLIGADHTKFVVLADQMAAAVAIKEFGFDHNINGRYFYPVPTGEYLHQLYEQVVWGENPAQAVIETKKHTNRDLVYVLLNKHFNNSDKLHTKLSTISQESLILKDYYLYKF